MDGRVVRNGMAGKRNVGMVGRVVCRILSIHLLTMPAFGHDLGPAPSAHHDYDDYGRGQDRGDFGHDHGDGHDHRKLYDVLGASPKGRGKPLCVIANTFKGKGVSFMHDNVAWHHGVPNKDQYEQAMRELV